MRRSNSAGESRVSLVERRHETIERTMTDPTSMTAWVNALALTPVHFTAVTAGPPVAA